MRPQIVFRIENVTNFENLKKPHDSHEWNTTALNLNKSQPSSSATCQVQQSYGQGRYVIFVRVAFAIKIQGVAQSTVYVRYG